MCKILIAAVAFGFLAGYFPTIGLTPSVLYLAYNYVVIIIITQVIDVFFTSSISLSLSLHRSSILLVRISNNMCYAQQTCGCHIRLALRGEK